MINANKIVNTIEEYRKALWAYKIAQHTNKSKYSPLVVYNNYTSLDKGSLFKVSLYDTWIQTNKPGFFTLGKQLVPGSEFSDINLTKALEKLLHFVKKDFWNDETFERL